MLPNRLIYGVVCDSVLVVCMYVYIYIYIFQSFKLILSCFNEIFVDSPYILSADVSGCTQYCLRDIATLVVVSEFGTRVVRIPVRRFVLQLLVISNLAQFQSVGVI